MMENCIHRIESRTATAGRCLRESIISFGFIYSSASNLAFAYLMHFSAYSNERKKARMSSARSCGSSYSPKWPPLGMSVQRTMLAQRRAYSRGVGNMSFGKFAIAVGTSTRPQFAA